MRFLIETLFRAGSLTDSEMLTLLAHVCDHVAPEVLERSVVVADRVGLRFARFPRRPDLKD